MCSGVLGVTRGIDVTVPSHMSGDSRVELFVNSGYNIPCPEHAIVHPPTHTKSSISKRPSVLHKDLRDQSDGPYSLPQVRHRLSVSAPDYTDIISPGRGPISPLASQTLLALTNILPPILTLSRAHGSIPTTRRRPPFHGNPNLSQTRIRLLHYLISSRITPRN